MNLLFTNAILLPMTASGNAPRTFCGSLAVAGNRIARLGPAEQVDAAFQAAHPDARTIDCSGKLLMPGLINTHCHAGMTLQRSYADDMALMPWLNERIWPFERCQRPEEVALGLTLGTVEMLLGGTTSFVDMYFHEDLGVRAVRRLGIRALLGSTYFDASVEQGLAEAERALREAAGCDRVRIAVAPHAPYTVSPENLVRGKEFCRRHGLMFMTHLAETDAETQLIRERYGTTPVRLLERLGLLDDRTVAAHCVKVDDEEIALLAERGVVVSHNPQSNMKLSSGTAPVTKMLAAGVRVTVATDGPCSNNDLDLFEELRSAIFLQKMSTGDPTVLPAYEALKMITVNGARAMGYADGELGVLREGALADLILLDLQKPHLQPLHDVVANVVYCAKASDVAMTVVDGEPVMEARRVRGVDLPDLYRRATAAVDRILAEKESQPNH